MRDAGDLARTGSAVPPVAHEERVRALFDGKAVSWSGKYAPHGPLARRLSQLSAAVGDHVAAGGGLSISAAVPVNSPEAWRRPDSG